MRTALDTTVVVAGLLSWHERHEPARVHLERALFEDGPAVLPRHTLVEAFAVLTRLPPPHRIRPVDAWRLLESSLRPNSSLAPGPAETWPLVGDWAARGLAGGVVYDALILAEARAAGARRLLTLNGRHFERLAGGDVEIVVPA